MAGYFAKPPSTMPPLGRGKWGQKLVGAWLFNEKGGTVAYNAAGAIPGTLINTPTKTTTPYGRGLTFNGTTQYITMGDVPAMRMSSTARDVSMLVVANITGGSGAYRAIAGKGWLVGTSGYGLYVTNGDKYAFQVRNASGPLSEAVGATTITMGRWCVLVGVRRAGVTKIYVNGVEDGTDSTAVTAGDGGDAFTVASRHNLGTPGFYTPGTIAGVLVWMGRGLSPKDVRAMSADPFQMFRRQTLLKPATAPTGSVYLPAYAAGWGHG